MKVEKDESFKTADEAIDFVLKHDRVVMYDMHEERLIKEINKLYSMIKNYNEKIDGLDDQYMATNPYFYRGIDGCLGVQCCEIDIGLYKDHHDHIALGGWNNSVLHGDYDVRPGMKAITTLMTMACIARKGD